MIIDYFTSLQRNLFTVVSHPHEGSYSPFVSSYVELAISFNLQQHGLYSTVLYGNTKFYIKLFKWVKNQK